MEEIFSGMILGDEEAILNSDKKRKELGDVNFINALRMLILQTIDLFWMDHLEMMDYLRSSVNLRAYGQRDPLVEYKKEGLKLFKEMESSISATVASALVSIKSEVRINEPSGVVEIHQDSGSFDVEEGSNNSSNTPSNVPKISEEKIGRNDPCPCGSGKKYKKCGELNTEEHQKLMSSKKLS